MYTKSNKYISVINNNYAVSSQQKKPRAFAPETVRARSKISFINQA